MSGITNAVARFERASARLAQAEPVDPVRDVVEQIVARHAFAGNVATVRTADEMLGTLIDTLA